MKSHQYSIAVVGDMNPAIHSPHWYRLADLISEADLQAALPTLTALPRQLVQFTTPAVQVQCTLSKWTATGVPDSPSDAVLQLAAKTFERLNDTPVSAFGLNLVVTHPLPNADTSRLVRAKLKRGPFAPSLGAAEPELEQMTVAYALEPLLADGGAWLHRRFRVFLSVRAKPAALVQVAVNVDHQIMLPGPVIFDMTRMLDLAAAILPAANSHAATLIAEALEG